MEDRFFLKKKCWTVFIVTSLGIGSTSLDAGALHIIIPQLVSEFNCDFFSSQIIINIYLLIVCLTLVPFGKLSDRFGRSLFYLTGLCLFLISSILCSVAASFVQLILYRGFQGLGAAMIMANNQSILIATFPSSFKGRILGLNSTIVSLGSMLGPLFGGFLVSYFSWRSIFLINIPFAIAGLILGLITLRDDVFLEKTLATQSPQKSLDASLFKSFYFVQSILLSFVSYLIIFANSALIPFYLNMSSGLQKAGIVLSIVPLMSLSFSWIGGYLSDRIGFEKAFKIGFLFMLGGLFSQTLFLAKLEMLALSQVFIGVGFAIFLSPNNLMLYKNVDSSKQSTASSIGSLARNVGKIFGVSFGITIYTSAISFFASRNQEAIHLQSAQFTFLLLLVVGSITFLGCVLYPRIMSFLKFSPQR